MQTFDALIAPGLSSAQFLFFFFLPLSPFSLFPVGDHQGNREGETSPHLPACLLLPGQSPDRLQVWAQPGLLPAEGSGEGQGCPVGCGGLSAELPGAILGQGQGLVTWCGWETGQGWDPLETAAGERPGPEA